MTTKNKHFIASGLTARLFEIIEGMSKLEKEKLLPLIGKKARKHVREPYIMAVDFETEDGSYRGFILDISVGGVNIETKQNFSIGQEISLSLPFPKLEEPLKITGRVVRQTPHGVGVMFAEITKRQLRTLEAIVNGI
jgi:Tfp pilus assembly protein PilZ